MKSKKTFDRSAILLRLLIILCVLETAVILCFCAIRVVRKSPPPAVLAETVWPEEKLPFAESNSYYLEREALFMRFSGGPVDLCCLGDSITHKFEWQSAFPDLRVANRGIGSDTTEGMLARLDSVAALEPKAVSVMAGINDLGQGRRPEEILKTYQTLIEELRSQCPGVKLIVSSVLPVRPSNGVSSGDIQILNQGLEALCREMDILYLDMFQVFADENGDLCENYAIDSVHLSPDGFALWLSYLTPALRESMK